MDLTALGCAGATDLRVAMAGVIYELQASECLRPPEEVCLDVDPFV